MLKCRLICSYNNTASSLTLVWHNAVPDKLSCLLLIWRSLLDRLGHSHKKRTNLETRAEPVVLSLQLEFRKLLEPSPRERAWNVNKKLRETTKQFKVKGLSWLSLCFVLNLRMSGESCLIFNWHNSRTASGISFFTSVPTKAKEYRINWRNNIVAVITHYLWYGDEGNLKKTLKTEYFELNYPQEKMICHK